MAGTSALVLAVLAVWVAPFAVGGWVLHERATEACGEFARGGEPFGVRDGRLTLSGPVWRCVAEGGTPPPRTTNISMAADLGYGDIAWSAILVGLIPLSVLVAALVTGQGAWRATRLTLWTLLALGLAVTLMLRASG